MNLTITNVRRVILVIVPILFLFLASTVQAYVGNAGDNLQYKIISIKSGMNTNNIPSTPYITTVVSITAKKETAYIDMISAINNAYSLFLFAYNKQSPAEHLSVSSNGINILSNNVKNENGRFKIPAGETGIFEFTSLLNFQKNGTYTVYTGFLDYVTKTGEKYQFEPNIPLGELKVTCKAGCTIKKQSNKPKKPTLTLSAKPKTIDAGETTTIRWKTKNVYQCYVPGIAGAQKLNGSTLFSSKEHPTGEFSLSCLGLRGEITKKIKILK